MRDDIACLNLDIAAIKALQKRELTRSLEHLLGMLRGMLADGHLHDAEIRLLHEWLHSNAETAATWPATAVARAISGALTDGVISNSERTHMMGVCESLIGFSFVDTGSAAAQVAPLPIDDAVTVNLLNSGVCHTGTFLYGSRAACERASLAAGAMCLDNVTKACDYLVVGTNVSRDWAHTSFGRKIQKAVQLQESGHEIEIISEQRWLEATNRH
jgi:NAD-dependent DNA ligase